MLNNISVLQVGNDDYSSKLHIPEHIKWTFVNDLEDAEERSYDICFLTRNVNSKECKVIIKKIRAYTLFVLDTVKKDDDISFLLTSRVGEIVSLEEFDSFLEHDSNYFYSYMYGEKFQPRHLSVSPDFKGNIYWNGYTGVELEGDFGEEFHQVIYWRNNVPLYTYTPLENWLEYEKEGTVEIQLKFEEFQFGAVSTLLNRWIFTEEDMKTESCFLEDEVNGGAIHASLLVKGKGKLVIKNLHDRHSRKNYGSFIPGGQRLVTSKREEVFAYFEPMDLKPPLNVYFSGYKTMEAFEGYYMMRKLGAPFILITDNRLEGGGFYLGDEEYEGLITSYIKSCLDKLGFDASQLVLSGLSMGTFGALYNGCKLRPHAILLGKPLANLGDIATNERINRPGTFPTSLDVLVKNFGDMSDEAVSALNNRFWTLFDSTDWSNTKFIISYMYEDDYDSTAYSNIIGHMNDLNVEIFGKGLHGRHNDNTGGIVSWFVNQYNQVLNVDFNRKSDEDE